MAVTTPTIPARTMIPTRRKPPVAVAPPVVSNIYHRQSADNQANIININNNNNNTLSTPFANHNHNHNHLHHNRQQAPTAMCADINNYYHIHDKKLGEGGFAKVRLATHLATRQCVAIKCLDKVKLGPELPRIYNEIECLKRLKHHNIARLYQVFETSSMIYLVLEYCAGGELFDYIVSKSRLEESESAQIIHDLMRVLDFIHVNGFAHRDLKPENVLFDDKHHIKLIDFGLAANCSASHLATNQNQRPLDQLSTCCGSVTYAAPEVISGAVYSGTQVDIWSAGVMMYALLVGQLPFNDNSIPKLYQKIQAGIKTLPGFLSAEACDLIKKMLTIDPKHRITVRDVLQHPWLRNRCHSQARISRRRLDFNGAAAAGLSSTGSGGCGGALDEQLLARCCEKFPNLGLERLKEFIVADFNYYSTTYHLMQAKCPPRTLPIKRTPDRLPVKRTPDRLPLRSVALGTPPRRAAADTRSPPIKRTPDRGAVAKAAAGASASATAAAAVAAAAAARSAPAKQAPTATVNRLPLVPTPAANRMSAFVYGPTPKKSIVKRLLESATPAKLRQPRRLLMSQNDEIVNITLTRYKDPNVCLSHFQEALAAKGFQCKRKDFSLKCFNERIRLVLEVCIYNNQCAIQRKRIKGDAWQYKLVCEEILRISNSSGVSAATCAAAAT